MLPAVVAGAALSAGTLSAGALSAGALSAGALSACSSVWSLLGVAAGIASSDTAPSDTPSSGTTFSIAASSAAGESDTPSDSTTMGSGACCFATATGCSGAAAAPPGAADTKKNS